MQRLKKMGTSAQSARGKNGRQKDSWDFYLATVYDTSETKSYGILLESPKFGLLPLHFISNLLTRSHEKANIHPIFAFDLIAVSLSI